MAYVPTNNANTKLAVGIGSLISDTSLQIEAGDIPLFPVINQGGTGSDYTMLTLENAAGLREIVKVTRHDASSATFTIVRGQEGTTRRAWSTGDSVTLRLTAGVLSDYFAALNDAIEHTITRAEATIASDGQQNVSIAYRVGHCFVMRNGAILNPADYTATDGNNITFASGEGIYIGDKVETVSFVPFTSANAVDLSSSQVVYGQKTFQLIDVASPTGDDDSQKAAPTSWVRSLLDTLEAAVVKLTGTQTVAGDKSFTDQVDVRDGELLCATQSTSDSSQKVASTAFVQAVVSGLTGSPAGMIAYFAFQSPPPGWLECAGQVVSRTTYSGLFAAIGVQFGAGDGSGTFGLPDMRGEFLRGWDHGRGVDVGRVFGSYQADELKSHTHTYTTEVLSRPQSGDTTNCWAGHTTANTGATGGSETRPRNKAFLCCIKT